jgi:hypothetical protein
MEVLGEVVRHCEVPLMRVGLQLHGQVDSMGDIDMHETQRNTLMDVR